MDYVPLIVAHAAWEALPLPEQVRYLWRYLPLTTGVAAGAPAERNGYLYGLWCTAERDQDDLAALYSAWPLDCAALALLTSTPDACADLLNTATRQAWMGGGSSDTGGGAPNWDTLVGSG